MWGWRESLNNIAAAMKPQGNEAEQFALYLRSAAEQRDRV